MRPGSGGWSGNPILVLFLPAMRSLWCLKATSLEFCFFQYLHVPLAGVPVHVSPKSFGRFAKAPQVVQSHLYLPCSTTLSAV